MTGVQTCALPIFYLPEQVVDVLARPIDSYGMIGCQNSIHAIQYVGPRGDDDPPCTITTVLQDIGIQYAGNWCHFRGRVAVYTSEGTLLLMSEDGTMDTLWAAKIRRFIQAWLPVDTVLGYDPKNDCIVLFNGRQALCYSLQNEDWSNPIYLDDFGITSGSVVSCQTSGRRLIVSVNDSGTFTAYEFDYGASTTAKPVSFVSHYTGSPSRAAIKNIDQVSMALESNYVTEPAVICLNRNLQPIALRGVTSINGVATILDPSNRFIASMEQKSFAIFGNNIGGGGIHYKTGTIDTWTDAGTIQISVALNANGSNLLMFVGDYVVAATPDYAGASHLPDLFPNVPDCKSYALAVWLKANDAFAGSVLETNLFGNIVGSGRSVSA